MTEQEHQSADQQARRRAFWIAYAAGAAYALVQISVNAVSVAHDQPKLDAWEPWIWELSSGLVLVALVPAVRLLVAWAPPQRGRLLRFAAAHLVGSIVFCLAHVGGFLAIRKAIYAAAGSHYGGADLLYEYRKDTAAYALIVGAMWLADWAADLWSRARAPAQPPTTIYHLREGATTVRAPVAEIMAVSSARNYVEFHMVSGRKPLVRTTLSTVERELAGCGFLRTHRSWLVNPAHVRTVEPAAAGDFRLELADGMSAPLSRRFPEALARLRSPEMAAA
jgi:hypothetical protein